MAIGYPGQQNTGSIASGQAYAQEIAGGMPMSGVIAPGVSYSPEQPGGYTQADLTPQFYNPGLVPVMPEAPGNGDVSTITDQMPYAPPGVSNPEIWGQPLNKILQGLDFTGLPGVDAYSMNKISGGVPSLFDIDVDALLKGIDTEELSKIDFSDINIPDTAPIMPQAPIYQSPVIPSGTPQSLVDLEQPIISPQVPVMPQAPVSPMNFVGLPPIPQATTPYYPTPPVSQATAGFTNLVQPNIDDIVKSLSQGRLLR